MRLIPFFAIPLISSVALCSSNQARAAEPVLHDELAPNTLLVKPSGAAHNLHIARPHPTLEAREKVVNPAAAQATVVSQYPSITTQWVQTVLTNADGVRITTYVEMIYTQTFAEVVSQGAVAGAGAIGLGTLTGEVGTVRTEQVKAGAVALGKWERGDWRGAVLGMVGTGLGMAVGGGLLLW